MNQLTKELVPTIEYPYIKYPFEFFNRMQSSVIKSVGYDKDVNLVLGTTTSSGKTIAAELFLGHTLAQKKKVLYVSPLKSLTQEKYDEWTIRFPDYTICILTGDYLLNSKRIEKLNKAHILCMTSEMVDSRTRKTASEKSRWLSEIGLVIIDESHIITVENRGTPVEAGLMRFAQNNKTARILCLSATMPNVDDFKTWLTTLNGKKTKVINSDWRPTQLDWHFLKYDRIYNYKLWIEHKINIAIDVIKKHPGIKHLVFVHDKTTGHLILKKLRELNISSDFHRADLAMEKRIEIEKNFCSKNNGIRVLVATSTLAWGKNTVARHVIIIGVERGITPVDELDIIQEGGRAGRFGLDPKGDVFLICDNPQKWQEIIKSPRSVLSTLLSSERLGFQVLAGIFTQEIWNKESFTEWYNKSLASIQIDRLFVNINELLTKVITELVKLDMIDVKNDRYYIKPLGQISAMLYYYPADVHHWNKNLNVLSKRDSWYDDLALSWVIGSAPTTQTYIPKPLQAQVTQYTNKIYQLGLFDNVRESMVSTNLYNYITGGMWNYTLYNLQQDILRFGNLLQMLSDYNRWNVNGYLKVIPTRIKYGIGKELVPLCELPNIGGTRSRKLYSAGIKSPKDINRMNRGLLDNIIGEKLTDNLLDYMRVKNRTTSYKQNNREDIE